MKALAFSAAALMVASLALATHAGAPKTGLEGDWDVVAMSRDGKSAPAEVLTEAFIRFTANAMVPVQKKTQKEQTPAKLGYKIVGAKQIDLTNVVLVGDSKLEKPTEKIVTKHGIFELAGDTLKIAWTETGATQIDDAGKITPLPPGTRPANLNGGPGVFAAVLKRR
jgi:uncharacterized protein (TIGR03067 family)